MDDTYIPNTALNTTFWKMPGDAHVPKNANLMNKYKFQSGY